MSTLLEVRQLTRVYGRIRALDGVSLTIEAGTIFGIVGESGCGKSTLARLVAALDRPTGGQVLLEGDDLFALPSAELRQRRRGFQMVFQDPYGSLDPRQRVGRIVAEPLHVLQPRPRGPEREALVSAVLDSVGLQAADRTRFPHEFSGGQRQRIALARALVTKPQLVIADEAVSALDLSVQAQILNLILDLRDRAGVAFLFISHNLAAVGAIADRIGVMYQGRLVETGPSSSFDAPLHPYTKRLLEAEPTLQAAGSPSGGSSPFPAEPADWTGCAFRSRCPLATERCLLEAPMLRAAGLERTVACHAVEL